jgi:DNA modification methylase
MKKETLEWISGIEDVKKLKPWKDNPRDITNAGFEKLKGRIKERGFHSSIVVDIDNTILSGNMRWRALNALGIKKVNILRPNRKLTSEERKKIALESNLNDGEWNMEALKSFNLDLLTDVGFDQMKLVEFWDKDAKVANEPFDLQKEIKIAQKTDIKRGNMYQLGRHKLICGDATDPNTVIKLMNGVKVDLINQDPPFNIGLSYDKGVGGKKSNKNYGGGTNDNMSDEGYKDFIKKMIRNALSVSKKDCHVAYWADERFVWIFQTLYKELGIASKRLLIWVKNNASPTPRTAFNKATEYIIYGTTGSPYLSPNVQNANEIINFDTTTGNDLLEELSNVILQKRLPSNQYSHPTQKDPQVHSKILKRCTKIGDAVLDLTAGSGSIMSACEQLGRVAYMCDYEPVFCQVILNRYKKMTGLNPIQIYEEK